MPIYLKVAPARRLPIKLQCLDYLAPAHLAPVLTPGQLVKIPFLKKEIFGIVTEINIPAPARPEKIKSIISLFSEQPVISVEQLNFLIEISEVYHTPLGFLLKENLPPLQPRKLAKLKSVEIDKNSKIKKMGPATMSAKPELFLYKTKTEKNEALKKISDTSKQMLILVPEISQINELAALFGDSAIIYHSGLSPKIKFERFWQVWRGEKKIIVGTRAALFLPFTELRQIILDEEGSPNYKSWDMMPRYHARDAALMLARHHGAALKLFTHTPSVESYYFAKAGVYRQTGTLAKFVKPEAQLIDLREERRGGNYNVLSEPALEAMANAPAGDWFFYVNRRGLAGYVGCRDCGYVAKCQKCERGMVYHRDTNNLQCHYCKTTAPFAEHCSNCRGISVVMYGAGTEMVENDARRMFADRAIIRLDADTVDSYQPDREDGRPKIFIGTQIAWPLINWEKLSLMIMVEADSTLFIPEYKTAENLFLQTREAQFRLPASAILLIQTTQIDHAVWNALYNPEKFYRPELQTRRQFQYPPFYYLVRVLLGANNQKDAETRINQYLSTARSLTASEKKVIIFGPLPADPCCQQGKYWQIVLFKLPLEKYKEWTKKIAAITPPDFKFDPNPNTLLSLS